MTQKYTGQGQPEHGEGHITVNANQYSYVTQGSWGYASGVDFPMFTCIYNPSDTQNDQIDYFIWLAKGTYTLSVLGRTGTVRPIATYMIDGVSIGTLDWYAAATDYSVIQTITNISITTIGKKIFSIKAATRNPLCGGWTLIYYSFAFFRTA